MKNSKSTAGGLEGKAKPASRKKNTCALPPADGHPGIKLPHARQEIMVTIGRKAAERYLDEGEQHLPDFWAGLRRMAPPQHLEDIEAGFLARLEQRIRSLAVPEPPIKPERAPVLPGVVALKGNGRTPMAVGGAALSTLLKQLDQLSSMAETGSIQATSSEGVHQLRHIQELLGSVMLIGTGGRAHG